MAEFESDGITISYEVTGEGPPVLLLHGFPQNRAMWGEVAPALADRFTVVTADLRGYGASSKPEALPDLSNYSFREMAADQRRLMAALGFSSFQLVGHDRGARVAHRLTLDAPEAVERLVLMDIVPTHYLLSNWSLPIARAYPHWTYLGLPAPIPERMIGADPDFFYEATLLGLGSATLDDFRALEAYRAAWRNPAMIAASTNDYRAALDVDFAHDAADLEQRVHCPTLVLWGRDGVMGRLYDVPAIWAERLDAMDAREMPGGHFFVDQYPHETCEVLRGFLSRG
ncbi:alpha/beta fold hydrolase [Silicimonas sp. MF1-12-2]|uniref:alpha/beta fold hydrolase n=1 Tax=Silicimonas sp. MF1-12-2 TaxID=3384793 RepID=UPI0039B60259